MKKLIHSLYIFALIILNTGIAFSFSEVEPASSGPKQILEPRLAGKEFSVHEVDSSTLWPKHRIGLGASTTSGYGLFYQYSFKSGYSLSLIGGTINGLEKNSINSDIGIQIQRNIGTTKFTRVFFHFGAFYNYSTKHSSESKPTDNLMDVSKDITLGTGFGVELLAMKHLSFTMECGLFASYGVSHEYRTPYDSYEENPILELRTYYPQLYAFAGGLRISWAF